MPSAEDLMTGCNPDSGQECGPVAPLAMAVNAVIDQRDCLCSLCGEMLATLTLPRNQEVFAKAGPEFSKLVEKWQAKFKAYSGEQA